MTLTDSTDLEGFLPTSEAELEACYAVGRMCFERDDFKRAADLFRFITLTDPTNQKGWWGLGTCHEAIEDFAVAARIYEIGFRLSGEAFALGYLSAQAWLKSGEVDDADRMLDVLEDFDFDADEIAKLEQLRSQMDGPKR